MFKKIAKPRKNLKIFFFTPSPRGRLGVGQAGWHAMFDVFSGSARHPSATNRKDLADKTVRRIAAQIGGKACVFVGADEPAQWYFAAQFFNEGRIALYFFWKVGRIVNEVLRDRVDLYVVSCNLERDGLYVG